MSHDKVLFFLMSQMRVADVILGTPSGGHVGRKKPWWRFW